MLPAQRSHVKASRRTIATHSTGRLRRPSAALAVACSLGAHAPFAPESLRTLRQARQRHPLRPGQLRSGRAAPVIDAPQPPDTRALWLGPRFRGLLLTSAERKGRHAPRLRLRVVRPPQLPRPIAMNRQPACRLDTFRGLLDGGYRFIRRTLLSFGPL
jgi:hypothetical protein